MSHTPGREPYQRPPSVQQVADDAVIVDWANKGLSLRVTHIRRWRIWEVMPVRRPSWWHNDWLVVLVQGDRRNGRFFIYNDSARQVKVDDEEHAKTRRAVAHALMHFYSQRPGQVDTL